MIKRLLLTLLFVGLVCLFGAAMGGLIVLFRMLIGQNQVVELTVMLAIAFVTAWFFVGQAKL